MKLTSIFRREYLLIAVATGAGMFAQETVSRISSADDLPHKFTAVSSHSWQTPETFYGSHKQAGLLFLVQAESPAVIGDQTPAPALQPLVDAALPADPSPEAIPSPQWVAVVARNAPHAAIRSWRADVESVLPGEPSSNTTLVAAQASNAPQAVAESVTVHPEEPLTPPEPNVPVNRSEPARNVRTDSPAAVVDVLPPPTPNAASPSPDVWSPLPAGDIVQSPVDFPRPAPTPLVSGVPAADDRRYVEPEQLVRERAIERADLRRQRQEAYRQMGYSPLRPAVPTTPYFGGGNPRPVVVIVPVVVRERECAESDR